MLAFAAISMAFARPILFPPQPLERELARGVSLYATGKSVRHLFMEDRQSVGTWSDGLRKRDVEEVIWLSPALMSRWVGYLDALEKWPVGERQRRWEGIRAALDGSMSFAVRLSAFPKKDWHEGDYAARADESALSPLRFRLTLDGMTIPRRPDTLFTIVTGRYESPANWDLRELEIGVCRLADRAARDRNALEQFPWHQLTPLAEWVTPEFEPRLDQAESIRLGDYRSMWLWVEARLDPNLMPRNQFELRIFSARRERIATFAFGPRADVRRRPAGNPQSASKQ